MDTRRLAGAIQSLIVSEVDPATEAPEGWLWPGIYWIQPTECRWRQWNGTSWSDVGITFTSIEVGNIEITSTLEVQGGPGITREVAIGSTTLKFSNGVLVEVEVE